MWNRTAYCRILVSNYWHRAIAQVDGIPKPVYQDKEGLAKLHPIVKMNHFLHCFIQSVSERPVILLKAALKVL
jgi:hypothetical protein